MGVMLAIALGACGGGGGGGGGGGAMTPPTALSYPAPATAPVGIPIPMLNPSVTGQVTNYTVTPALPAGLTLDSGRGTLSGVPSGVSPPTTYTISASNTAGSTSFSWRLAIIPAASAGASATVSVGQFVTLDGSASATTSGDALAYAWTLRSVPTGSSAALASPRSTRPIFKADLPGIYVADLIVRDGASQSSIASVTITATPAAAFIPPPAPTSSQTVSACMEITAPGSYRLSADLTSQSSSAACVRIHDTSAVVLDCDHHRISDNAAVGSWALSLAQVQGVTIQNCVVETAQLIIDSVSDTTFVANSIAPAPGAVVPAELVIRHPLRLSFDHNDFAGGYLYVSYADTLVVSNNTFATTTGPGNLIGAFVWTYYGTHARIVGNVMDGRWDGLTGAQYSYNGVDDGILLGDETDALVENNTIRNVFDTGIEWTGVLRAARVRANVVVNAGFSGFGGWYWQSVIDSTFAQNLLQNTQRMYAIYNNYGIRPAGFDGEQRMPADAGVFIQNNLFDGNVFSDGRNPLNASAYMRIFGNPSAGAGTSGAPGERVPTAADFHLSSNAFINNIFDPRMAPPDFNGVPVTGVVIDGGGNACQVVAGYVGPLVCSP
jgi:hypothetical protein